MFNQFKLFLAIATTLSILGVVATISRLAGAQNSSQNDQPPRQFLEQGRPVGVLLPPPDAQYVVLPAGGKITGRLGLPAAQLIDPPAELAQEVAVWVPKPIPKDEAAPPSIPADRVSYQIISSVRYKGNGNTIFVTTARPSPGAAKLKLDFGKPDKLADNTEVGITVACESLPPETTEGFSCTPAGSFPPPNQVKFMRGKLIINVASDLPIEQVKDLAKNAILKNPSSQSKKNPVDQMF